MFCHFLSARLQQLIIACNVLQLKLGLPTPLFELVNFHLVFLHLLLKYDPQVRQSTIILGNLFLCHPILLLQTNALIDQLISFSLKILLYFLANNFQICALFVLSSYPLLILSQLPL